MEMCYIPLNHLNLRTWWKPLCERACDTDLAYKECAKGCASGELQEGWACHIGCRKLDTAMKHRFGDCPSTGALEPKEGSEHWLSLRDAGASAPPCILDLDCPGNKKCCSRICMVPTFGDDIPELVQPPQITEGNRPRSFELTWNVAGENKPSFAEPVIYVLQVRTYFGPEFDPMAANAWKTLTMTTIPGARLSEPDVGWWYQYRIAAVNRFGSRGFGDSTTPPVHLTSQLPQAASAPRQLVDGVWRFQADGGVHVRIEWKAPTTAVIPVTEYRISWAPEDSSSDKRAVFEDKMSTFLHIVPASQTHYLLRNLKANMSYHIQVQAISSWGSKTFTSAPASHFIITPELPKREPYYQHQSYPGHGVSNLGYGGTQVPCSCDNVRERGGASKLQISSNFRPLRFPQSPGGFLTVRFANDPGVSDGQFLKTILTVNEFAESYNAQFSEGENLSPKLLTIQWKQQACIETGEQISKTFMPLKPLDEFGSGSAGSEYSRFLMLEPVEHGEEVGLLPEGQLTRTGRVEISSLQLNCHYAIFVAPNKRKSNGATLQQHTDQPPIHIGCLCTPACFDDQSIPWASHFSCSTKESDALLPPTNLRSQLVSDTSFIYNMSWRPPTTMRHLRSPRPDIGPELNLSEIFYRVTWGPAMDRHLTPHTLRLMADPYPRLSPTESQTKVLPSTKTSILLNSLQPNSVYVFKIQLIHLRSSEHLGSQQEESLSKIIQASREVFLYVQTPLQGIKDDSFRSVGGAIRKVNTRFLMTLLLFWTFLYLTSPR
ncbi:Anosmin-1 [Echinococcus granulosus]|nr:Anosmin-1 [Echinococcus granulosus]